MSKVIALHDGAMTSGKVVLPVNCFMLEGTSQHSLYTLVLEAGLQNDDWKHVARERKGKWIMYIWVA